MGGDQLIPALVPDVDRSVHGAVEETRAEEYATLIDEVELLEGRVGGGAAREP